MLSRTMGSIGPIAGSALPKQMVSEEAKIQHDMSYIGIRFALCPLKKAEKEDVSKVILL